MITNLRNAKASLSELVQRAAGGEEVLITVRGEPTARLVALESTQKKRVDMKEWAAELREASKNICVGPPVSTPQSYWDEERADR